MYRVIDLYTNEVNNISIVNVVACILYNCCDFILPSHYWFNCYLASLKAIWNSDFHNYHIFKKLHRDVIAHPPATIDTHMLLPLPRRKGVSNINPKIVLNKQLM